LTTTLGVPVTAITLKVTFEATNKTFIENNNI
jgi:hypothetical protein